MNTAAQQEITWRLDPTVASTARFGDYRADVWWTGPGPKVGWIIHPLGEGMLDAVAQGTAADEADAQAQAEHILRRLAAARLTKAQVAALIQLADPARTTERTLFPGNGVQMATARALVNADLCEWHPEPYMSSHRSPRGWRTHYQREWGIRLATPGNRD
jgi:hypothetical protein